MNFKFKLYQVGVITILVGFLGCEEELSLKQQKYSFILTNNVVGINEPGATFKATLLKKGTDEILDHGFVWATTQKPTLETSFKVQLGNQITNFSHLVDFDLRKNRMYFVRAFVVTSDNIIYGNEVTFNSQGSVPASITSFSPQSGVDGDTITILGEHFSSIGNSNFVKFGFSSALTVISKTRNEILAIVPPTAAGACKISLSTLANLEETVISDEDFTVNSPAITSFTPTSGSHGTIVTISGNNFSVNKNYNTVYFGSNTAIVMSSTRNEIKAMVPYSSPGNVKIKVALHTKNAISANDFLLIN